MLYLIPLVVALFVVALIAAVPVSDRLSLTVSRLSIPIFGGYVSESNPRRTRQLQLLRATHVGATHRVYAARTLFFAGAAGVLGSILGVYVGAAALVALSVNEAVLLEALPRQLHFFADLARIDEIPPRQLFVLFVVSSATIGSVSALGVYWGRWRYLESKAEARATEIEATLPRTVAFVYALSRSGMPFPTVLETLTRNQSVYGEAAKEVGVAVRDMDAFGTDVLTALQRMADRTPSHSLEEFGENLASVLGSGRSLSEFLTEQYDRYQQEAEAQQEQYLDLLSAFAEIYVTVLVAGPLFFITVLVVIGLVLSDTLTLIRLVGYVGLPIASVGFIAYIRNMTESLRGASHSHDPTDDVSPGAHYGVKAGTPAADGGNVLAGRWEANWERLELYDRFEPIRRWLYDPLNSLLARPESTLVVTVPVAVAWVFVRSIPIPLGPSAINVLDGPIIEATIFVMAIYALIHEIHRRQTRAIEDAVPDFLDRMASVNEAGMTITESIGRVRSSDLGQLSDEIERTWRDVQWGADIQTALRRFERRVDTVMVSQAVTLITNAMKASGDIAPVLRIAADEAQESRRLRQERRQEMFTYLLVIYISFLVFIGIISALSVAFIPAINAASGAIGGGSVSGGVGVGMPGGTFGGIEEVNTEAYSVLFFHIASIQAVCSGLTAGLLGEGDLEDGVKHATILLTMAYVVAIVLF